MESHFVTVLRFEENSFRTFDDKFFAWMSKLQSATAQKSFRFLEKVSEDSKNISVRILAKNFRASSEMFSAASQTAISVSIEPFFKKFEKKIC